MTALATAVVDGRAMTVAGGRDGAVRVGTWRPEACGMSALTAAPGGRLVAGCGPEVAVLRLSCSPEGEEEHLRGRPPVR